MRNILFIVCLFLVSYSYGKEIAISFDDCPRRFTGHFTRLERAKALVKQLMKAKVPAPVFYCNSSQINDETKAIVEIYNKAGFVIANHTHTHPDFTKVSYEKYSSDFLEADQVLSKYSNYKRLFRYPYLREGNKAQSRDQMRALLKKKSYRNGYITVDFSDWHLESLLRDSIEKKQKVDFDKLKKLYLSLAKQALEHYDAMAVQHLGRSPKHVLLLHETDLAALYINDLVSAMKTWGWTVISSDEAYKDPIADFIMQKPLGPNPGRVGEIAISKGHDIKKVWAQATYPKYITGRYESEVLAEKFTGMSKK